jgi:hypothetical protein
VPCRELCDARGSGSWPAVLPPGRHRLAGSRGRSGHVAWRVIDIQQTVSEDRRSIWWDYVLVLGETAGTAVHFEHVESSAESRRHTDLMVAPVREPFERTLSPHGTLRIPLRYGIVFSDTSAPSFDQTVPGGREGVVRSHRLVGRTTAGASVAVDVRITLDSAAGIEKRRDGPGLTGRYQGSFGLYRGAWQGRRTWGSSDPSGGGGARGQRRGRDPRSKAARVAARDRRGRPVHGHAEPRRPSLRCQCHGIRRGGHPGRAIRVWNR